MSHTLDEVDNFDSAIQTPDILDTTYPQVVMSGLTSLTNRTRNLLNTIDPVTPYGSVGYSDVAAQFTSVAVPDPARFPNTGVNNPLAFAVRQLLSNLRM